MFLFFVVVFFCFFLSGFLNSFINSLQAGANMIVSGSAVIQSENPRETIQYMRNVVDGAIEKTKLER